MLMVAPNEGKTYLLDWMIRTNGSAPNLSIQLFTNDFTPDNDSVLADFDLATFTGADPLTLTRSAWDAPFVASDVAYIEYPTPPTWVCSGGGPQTCYGWVAWEQAGSHVVFAQRFDASRVMDAGATESLVPFVIALQPIV